MTDVRVLNIKEMQGDTKRAKQKNNKRPCPLNCPFSCDNMYCVSQRNASLELQDFRNLPGKFFPAEMAVACSLLVDWPLQIQVPVRGI